MSTNEGHEQSMAACGGCSAIIPIDSTSCPECGIRLGGEQQRWECGACGELFDHEPRSCTSCGVVFVADDVVHVLRAWLDDNGMSVMDLFGRFDTNGDGVIDSSELKEGLLALNLAALPPEQVDLLVRAIDENGDGSIDLGELEATLASDDASLGEEQDGSSSTLDFNENVLERVMANHGIGAEEREAFLEHASTFNDDGNTYLKKDELEKAASSWASTKAVPPLDDALETADDEAGEDEFEGSPEDDDEVSDVDIEDDVEADQPAPEHAAADEDDEAEVIDDAEEDDDAKDDGIETYGGDEADDVDEADDDADDEVSEESVVGSDDEDDEVEDDEDEEDEDEDAVEAAPGVDTDDPFGALLDALEDLDITQMFHEVDTDGSGSISIEELYDAIVQFTGLEFSMEQVETIARTIDADSDGSIDRVEFIAAVEEHDGVVEPVVIPEKPFPSPMQKRMMSKSWNDVVWPLIHASFALILLLLFVNALIGPVDGAGGRVAFDPSDAHTASFGESYYDPVTKETYFAGDIYDCEPTAQEGKCRNSLAPLAGTKGESGIPSMPAGFYWDAWLAIFLTGAGLVASLVTQYVIVPGWRARARAMRELELDHEDASSEMDDDEGSSDDPADEEDLDEEYDDEENDDEEYDDEEYDDEEYDDEEYDDEEYDDEEYNDEEYDDEEGEDEPAIDVGSHVGVEIDGEDYFGTIVEFNDDEGTVTIEEDGTGDLIEAEQDSMFLE